jgi:hypothetical protein
MMRFASRLSGSDCSQTRPGPRKVAKNSPSPPQRGLDLADELDVVLDRRLERDDAPGVDADQLAGPEGALLQCAARVHERPAVSLEPLHDEPFPAEEARPQAPLKRDSDTHALRRGQEGVLLGDQLAADLGQVHRDDLARVRRTEGDLAPVAAAVQEDGHEERFTGEQTLARAHQRSEEAALLLRSVPEDRLHLDAVVHVHHAAGLGNGRLVGIQLDFDELHVVAEDPVIDLVHRGHACNPLSPEPAPNPPACACRGAAGSAEAYPQGRSRRNRRT